MDPVILSLFVATALLMACCWHHKVNATNSKVVILIGILIFVIDYVILQYLSKYTQNELLRILWVKLAIATLVPILILKGKLTGIACLSPLLIGVGLLFLLVRW